MEDVGVVGGEAGFAALQGADQVPGDAAVRAEGRFNGVPLFRQFFSPILTKVAHAGFIGGQDSFRRPGFGDGDQGDLVGVPPGFFGGLIDALGNGRVPL